MSDIPKIDKLVQEHCRSYTWKYFGFYATHFHKGIKCYVVGAVNLESGETTERHYNERGYANEDHARHKAIKCWEELKEGLERKPTEEETKLDEQLLECWNEAARQAKEKLQRRLLN